MIGPSRAPYHAESNGPGLELWGGVECTVNRVGDRYFDQLEWSGHAHRPDDLDRFAGLGLRTFRYPVLWERTAPDRLESADWSWPDERLGRLRALGVRPIVGLVHHGSGPRHTSLVDPAFADGLAAYAGAVAERYPWIDGYTPVNEPLTTARFSGLYGHWYPHGKDGLTFARALLVQCRATVLAMRAIRQVNPSARLVQTEDLGKTSSTPTLAYQAAFDNERRWLTFDLLCGRVDPGHPMWQFFRWLGVAEAELHWFLDHPCPPDVLGINYYVTSERFLDERTERYPSWKHGTNGRHAYADVSAVRVLAAGLAGPGVLLDEAWQRYRLPLAISECHLYSAREGQLQWLLEVWEAARQARRGGADVRAVTTWAMLGSYDWDMLVTRPTGHYEPGVFDVRSPLPRPTALAALARDLVERRQPAHPVVGLPGWWRTSARLLYPPLDHDGRDLVLDQDDRDQHARGSGELSSLESGRGRGEVSPPAQAQQHLAPTPGPTSQLPSTRPILITGATGTLGRAFARRCSDRGLPHALLTRQDMDIADAASVEAALGRLRPWAVVNAAGYVRVDDAEAEPETCFRENTRGPEVLAAVCARRGARLVTFSSDLVFDGSKDEPYLESDAVAPCNVYGQSKAESEARVLAADPTALVVRTSAFFGPWDQYNFVTIALHELAAGRPFVAADDAVVSPTYVPDLVDASLDLLVDGERGIWHLASRGAITWAALARRAAELARVDPSSLVCRPTAALDLAARRPRYSVLESERATLMPTLEDALARYLRERATVP